MITEASFPDLLLALGFKKKNNLFIKKFPHFETSMQADFSKRKLIFPDKIKGRERNDGFNAPENFVVFECVHRLLEKGYRPEHIELEKQWQLGHDQKGGRADVCVSDPKNKSILFIVECKTWGKEYDNALKDTKHDGAQLFSYWQQEQSCKWLVLYSSDLNRKKEIVYKAPTINCSDDENYKLLAKKDKSIKLYETALSAESKFNVWKETYKNHFEEDLIFSDDSRPYKIGVKPLLKKDLRHFDDSDNIIGQFEEILRHNNVSDKENAFNRLIALFICKLQDESNKKEDDEVEFQYKLGTDTYETLQDRLQKLHRDGMKDFMQEDIFYVSNSYPEELFQQYTGTQRKKAIEDLRNTIRSLKFFSNNDFAFKEVHNEELFYQNGKILVEMVQLFEKYRIVYPSKDQLLGDLFERLLNKGFKQNEGQFFTPIPITRFIWDCLPLKQKFVSERGTIYPKVVDYACGAGHFLTEGIEAINNLIAHGNENDWVANHIYGIEKDYRLARVAKISLFMNGAGEGNIIFGDGLENVPKKGVDNGIFDILVANPPYSVKDFTQHLQLKNNKFTIQEHIGLNGSEIETLFVERINQLLKPQGIAAVILPSSILSNESKSYVLAREQLLKYFYIRAIVAFGSKTFGATGTNTVVMFLEKFNEPPKQIDLSSDSADAIFSGSSLEDWEDKEILEEYIKQINVDENKYKSFLQRSFSLDDLRKIEYCKMYVVAFENSTEAKKLKNTRAFKNRSTDEQNSSYLESFYTYAHKIEREKLLYFSLVYHQKTVIITAPTDNKKQEGFLGYEWSNRKGNEGIIIRKQGGELYDDNDREKEGTLAHAIKQSFNGVVPSFSEEQKAWASVVNTKDMLNFSRVSFNKAIRLSIENTIELTSKYPFKSLFDVATLFRGVTYDKAAQRLNPTSNIVLTADNITLDGRFKVTKQIYIDETKTFSDDSLLKSKDIFICMSSGSKKHVGKVAYIESDTNYYAGGFMGIIRTEESTCISKYLYYVLNLPIIKNLLSGESFGSNINNLSNRIGTIKIPVPPLSVQQQIIDECSKIDAECDSTRMSIKTFRQKIENLFHELDEISSRGLRLNLADSTKFDISIGKRVLDKQLVPDGTVPVFSANVINPFGYVNELLITDFSVPSVLWGIDGDWMTNYIPANSEFYPTDHCGVLRCRTNEINPRFMAHILKIEGNKMGFSRSYRAAIERVKGITFTVCNRSEQDKIITKIEAIEKQLHIAKTKLESLTGKTVEILNQYLNK